MYIISEFHDYYDSASSLGFDKQCPYIRTRVESEHKFGRDVDHPQSGSVYHSRQIDYTLSYRIIGFCGKIYPLVIVEKRWYDRNTYQYRSEDHFFYNEEALVQYLAENKVSYSQYTMGYWRVDRTLGSTGGLARFFDPESWKHFLDYFQKYKVPIFLIGSKHLILNPRLKEYNFHQIKDVYSAYQDIYMYISGVLGVETKPTIQISDEVKAAAKGHDGKYSFRKPPGGKRGKPRWR